MRRREALAGIASGLVGATAFAGRSRRAADEVVLYSSVDSEFLGPVVAAYEKSAGVHVRVVGDTEATKTTGLVQRLLAERRNPRCDVWWSSEALGTAELAQGSVFDEYDSPAAKDWPARYRDPARRWYALALRARVIVYNRDRVTGADVPVTLADLLHERFKGRVGMARPRFGTTRTHMAAICAQLGEPALRELLTRLKANGVRLYDGNSSVVRSCASGEIHAGLTDTDDVYAGKRNAWPLEMSFGAPPQTPANAPARPEPAGADALLAQLRALGTLTIPNTVALVRKAPNQAAGKALIDHIVGGAVERALARSESRNTPVRPEIAGEFPALAIPNPWNPDPTAIMAAAPKAEALCAEILRS